MRFTSAAAARARLRRGTAGRSKSPRRGRGEAQMMFFRTEGRVPPKKSRGASIASSPCRPTGMAHLSNSMPMSRSTQETRSPGRPRRARRRIRRSGPPLPVGHERAPALVVAHRLHLLEHHAGELAVEVHEALGTRKLRIGMPSCIASSFSHGLAFISSKPERTITFTSSTAEAARRAAAVHRRVAAAEHDDAPADLAHVAEGDRRRRPAHRLLRRCSRRATTRSSSLGAPRGATDIGRWPRTSTSGLDWLSSGRLRPREQDRPARHRARRRQHGDGTAAARRAASAVRT